MTSIPQAAPSTTATSSSSSSKSTANNNNASCSQLDLSWLSASVMEAALDNKNLSLSDLGHLTSGLQAAQEFGHLDMDSSEKLANRIVEREEEIKTKMIRKEFVAVVKKLQIYRLLKTHKTWEQVHYMADMHGQGAYILMKDFNGLAPDDVKLALKAFYNHLQQKSNQLPFSPNSTANIQHLVAAKLCRAYKNLLASLNDTELGGYDPLFLQTSLKYKTQDLMDLWNVSSEEIAPINDPAQEAKNEHEEAKILGDKTDDEDSDDDDDHDDGNDRRSHNNPYGYSRRYYYKEEDLDETYRSLDGDHDDPFDHYDSSSRHAGRY